MALDKEGAHLLRYTPSIIAIAFILFLCYLVFLVFKPFITALIIAGVIVVVFNPLHLKLKNRMPNSLAALLSTLFVFIVVIIPASLIMTGIIFETINLSQSSPSMSFEKIMSYAHELAGKFGIDLSLMIKDTTQKIVSQAGLIAAQIIGNAWNIAIGILVALLAIFFFFRDGEKMRRVVQSLPYAKSIENLANEIVTMIKSNITASFVSASLQGIIGGFAFAWFALPAPILWGTIMGFFSLFPFIGSWLVWIPAATTLALDGQVWNAMILIIIGLAVVNPIDNILRPSIVASSTKLNGLLVFISLLGGVQAFGISGLLLGPILMLILIGSFKSSMLHIRKSKVKS